MGSYYYYSPRPNFLNVGVYPTHKKEIEDSFINIQDPIRRGHIKPLKPCPPPIDEKRGFMVKNNARLAYTAVFDFEYDDHSKVHSEVSEGDKVFVTFNNSAKGEFNVVTITAILTKIEPINDNKDFVLYLDASEVNKSSVYKVGSRAILDIGRVDEDREEKKDLDPAETVEEITDNDFCDFPPMPPVVPLPYHPDHHHHHPCPPPPMPAPKRPDLLTWSDKKVSTEASEKYGYDILHLTYSKKQPVDTMLVIYSAITGEIVYKAIDDSKKISSMASFTWDYRNYSNALQYIPLIEKIENFSVDDAGRVVLTPYADYNYSDKANEYLTHIAKSNDNFINPGKYFVQIATGPDLINYNPINPCIINRDITSISMEINITGDAIKNAAYYGPVITPKGDNVKEALKNLTKDDTSVTIKGGVITTDEIVLDTPAYHFALCGNKADTTAATGDRATEEIGIGETVVSCPIKVTGSHDLDISGFAFTDAASIDVSEFEGNLRISNCKFVSPAVPEKTKPMGFTLGSDANCVLDLNGNYFGSSDKKFYNGLELNGKIKDESLISNNYFSPDFCSHNAINIYDVEEGSTITIKDNTLDADNFARIGIKGEPKCTIDFVDNKIKSADPLDPIWNSPILVQPYNKDTTSFGNCTINIENLSGLAEGARPILAACNQKTDTDITDKLPTVTVDGESYTIELEKF